MASHACYNFPQVLLLLAPKIERRPLNRGTLSSNPPLAVSKHGQSYSFCQHYLYPFSYTCPRHRQHYFSSDSIHEGKYPMVVKRNAHTCALIPVAPMTLYMYNPHGATVGPPVSTVCMYLPSLNILIRFSVFFISPKSPSLEHRDHFVFSGNPVKWIIKKV